MAIKGLAEVRRNLQRELVDETNERAKQAVKVGTSIIAGYATLMTPVDTSVLINSQYQAFEGTKGMVGYTAEYAAYVHEASGKLKGQQRPKRKGNPTGEFWSPDAEPEFLRKAGDDNLAEIEQAVIQAMRV